MCKLLFLQMGVTYGTLYNFKHQVHCYSASFSWSMTFLHPVFTFSGANELVFIKVLRWSDCQMEAGHSSMIPPPTVTAAQRDLTFQLLSLQEPSRVQLMSVHAFLLHFPVTHSGHLCFHTVIPTHGPAAGKSAAGCFRSTLAAATMTHITAQTFMHSYPLTQCSGTIC